MKILILGAGRVGQSVAESLVSERNDITVIDTDPARLRELQDRLDLRGVVGNGIQPSVLREAGIEDADMLIACAPQDETNLVACKVAHDVFNVPTTIARVRSPEFENGSELLGKGLCGGPGDLPRAERHGLHPQAHRIPRSAAGAGVRPRPGQPDRGARGGRRAAGAAQPGGDPAAGAGHGDAHRGHLPPGQGAAVLDGDTRIEPGDEVFVLAATEHIRTVLGALRQLDRPVRRLMMAGGGKVGLRLAREIHADYQLKIIEIEPHALRVPGHSTAEQHAGAAWRQHRRGPAGGRKRLKRWTSSWR
jgi:trk system potassium uptake protein TrkA